MTKCQNGDKTWDKKIVGQIGTNWVGRFFSYHYDVVCGI